MAAMNLMAKQASDQIGDGTPYHTVLHQAGILREVEGIDPFTWSHNPRIQLIDLTSRARMCDHDSISQCGHQTITSLCKASSWSSMGRSER
jgi:hypothetical protein